MILGVAYAACVGARGIKRRKPKRELPDFVDHLPPGDEQRVFGRFSSSVYSPDGGVERAWFFGRQLRHPPEHMGRDALRFMLLALPIVLGFVGVMMLIAFMFHRG